MLAPRKKLWSTPREVIVQAITLLNIQENDIVYDIGCGDGNFLFQTFQHCYENFIVQRGIADSSGLPLRIIGVDIEETRISDIRAKVRDMRTSNAFSEGSFLFDHLSLIHANALDLQYNDGTCFYLYLIPRGLKRIIEILQNNIHHRFRVVTFMYPIPNHSYKSTFKVHSSKHDESQWPLYYYEFG